MLASGTKFKVDQASVAIDLMDTGRFFTSCLSKRSPKEKRTFLQAFSDEFGEIPRKATTLFHQIQNKAYPFEIDFHFVYRSTEFHVVRNLLTGEYTEEPVFFADQPIKLDLKA